LLPTLSAQERGVERGAPGKSKFKDNIVAEVEGVAFPHSPKSKGGRMWGTCDLLLL
jgi:hypothetical protein